MELISLDGLTLGRVLASVVASILFCFIGGPSYGLTRVVFLCDRFFMRRTPFFHAHWSFLRFRLLAHMPYNVLA